MRILVISDSHGDSYAVREAVVQQPSARTLYFLGDGEHDLDFARSVNSRLSVFAVKGNCDYGSQLPSCMLDEIEGRRIYCTHGYLENVKYGTSVLLERAKEHNASVALYGHTHNADTTYCDGIWLVNPGSIRNDSYAVIDFTPNGIMPVIMKLR